MLKGPQTVSYSFCPNYESLCLEKCRIDSCIFSLDQTFTFGAPSKINVLSKYCISMPGPWGLGVGFFVTQFYFAKIQKFARYSFKYMEI